MNFNSYLQVIVYGIAIIIPINAIGSDDCLSNIKEEQGCSVISVLEKSQDTFKIHEEETVGVDEEKILLTITETLPSVKVKHKNREVLIKRENSDESHTCPPFCIQPMNIGDVKGVGELEVLKFIQTLNKKEPKLLIDARTPTLYKISTIPGAINIPHRLLEDDSQYQTKVLELLGAEKKVDGWSFNRVPTLLIFGNSEEDSQASEAIKMLLKLSCPSSKMLYYRGGVKAWKRLGLTLY